MSNEIKKPQQTPVQPSSPERDHISDMLIEWAPLIHYHVKTLKDKIPAHVDHEDLYAAGMHGLMDAFHNYNPKTGASFKTYASQRIKGRMLDHAHNSGGNAVDKYHYVRAKELKQPQAKPVVETTEAPDIPKKPENT